MAMPNDYTNCTQPPQAPPISMQLHARIEEIREHASKELSDVRDALARFQQEEARLIAVLHRTESVPELSAGGAVGSISKY